MHQLQQHQVPQQLQQQNTQAQHMQQQRPPQHHQMPPAPTRPTPPIAQLQQLQQQQQHPVQSQRPPAVKQPPACRPPVVALTDQQALEAIRRFEEHQAMLPCFQQVEAQLAAQAAAPAAAPAAAASGSADPYPPGQWGPSNAAASGLMQTQWEHHIMLLRMALESAEALRRSAQGDFKKEQPP